MRFIKILAPAVFVGLSLIMLSQANPAAMDSPIGQWQNTTPLTADRMDFSLARSDNYLYLVGGCGGGCGMGATKAVERAQISPGGDIGTWLSSTEMKQLRQGAAAVVVGNYLYALGGADGFPLSSVERAPIDADGSLGSWEFLNPMATARSRFGAVVIGSYLYAIGGMGPSFSATGEPESSVERARINADGTLGAWTQMASLTAGRMEFASFAAGDYLYALGGEVKQGSRWASSDTVERASVNPDGSLGPWQVITTMPVGRHSLAAAYVGGNLYVLGGGSIGDPIRILNSVDSATVYSDGSIGPWRSMPSMLSGRYLHGAIALGPYLYAIGGTDSGGGSVSSVERAPIAVDDTPPVVNSFVINGGALASTSRNVTLTVLASDSQSPVAEMSFSDDGYNWSDWQSYSPSSTWLLTAGNGPKTIYVCVKDAAGNTSLVSESQIALYTSVGMDGALTISLPMITKSY